MSLEPVSIVVPTYREAENIPVLTERLFSTLSAAGARAELIIVDDDSRDGTEEAVRRLEARYPVRLIVRTGERGLSSAVMRGFEGAGHDLLVCMDADLSHPPESVPELIKAITDHGADFCIGSRYVEGGRTKGDWSLLRKINSLGATWLARPLTSARDPMAGFFCLRREIFENAKNAGLNPIGYKIALEIMVKAGCRRVVEVPIEFSDRLHGQSKLTFRQQLLYLRHLIALYGFRWPWAIPLLFVLFSAGGALLLFRIVAA